MLNIGLNSLEMKLTVNGQAHHFVHPCPDRTGIVAGVCPVDIVDHQNPLPPVRVVNTDAVVFCFYIFIYCEEVIFGVQPHHLEKGT